MAQQQARIATSGGAVPVTLTAAGMAYADERSPSIRAASSCAGTGGHAEALPDCERLFAVHDDFSTTNTESLVNGSSAAVNMLEHQDIVKPHPAYLIPPKVTHPLEDNFGWVFLRGCCFHVIGLLVGLPIVLIVLLTLCIVCPIRLCLWLVGSVAPFCGSLRRHMALADDSCDPWWPMSTHAEPHASLVQCIVTLQSPIEIDEARRAINNFVFGIDPTGTSTSLEAFDSDAADPAMQQTPRLAQQQEHSPSALDRLMLGGSGGRSRSYTRVFTRLPAYNDECCLPPPASIRSGGNGSGTSSVAGGAGGSMPHTASTSARSRALLSAALRRRHTDQEQERRVRQHEYEIAQHVFETHTLQRIPSYPHHGSALVVPTAPDATDAGSSTTNSYGAPTGVGVRGRIASLRDLECYVNMPVVAWSKRRPAWSVKLLQQFGNVDEGTCCSLVLIEMQASLTNSLCPLRFLSLWTNGCLSFDVEPKYRRSFLFGGVLPPYNVFLTLSYALWTLCQLFAPHFALRPNVYRTAHLQGLPNPTAPTSKVYLTRPSTYKVDIDQAISASPLCLLRGALRPPEPVWSYSPVAGVSFSRRSRRKLRGGSAPVNRRYRGVSNATNGSGATGNAPTDRRHSGSLASSALIGFGLAPSYKRVTWARISNMDQLLRAERILRAATVELLLAFVAGALRRHFRSQGIRHPPNVRVAVPVSNRDFTLPIAHRENCDFLLVPVEIPTGIEGNIPRIWAIQRALADALDEPFPLGARLARFCGKLLLPRWAASRLQRCIYNDTGCSVSFIRASGDASLHARRIHSILCYSPVPDSCRAAFGFIQCGTEMVVTLTADTRLFNEPDTLLAYFQAEVLSLLRQLSVRLLTLSQATYLPPCPLQSNVAPSPPVEESPVVGGASQERPLLTATAVPATAAYTATTQQMPLSTLSPNVTALSFDDSQSNASGSLPLTPSVTVEMSAEESHGMLPSASTSALPRPSSSTPFRPPSGAGHDRQRSMSRSSRTSRSLLIEAPSEASATRRSSFVGDPHESASLEELEQLLHTVQIELDNMKANPQGDRGEYVAKLTELERKMEEFHTSIARRLGPQLASTSGADSVFASGDRDTTVVDELLAPYWEEERAAADRRASRDSSSTRRRSSVVASLLRKRSSHRRIESPISLRRLSPKPSTPSAGSRESLHPH